MNDAPSIKQRAKYTRFQKVVNGGKEEFWEIFKNIYLNRRTEEKQERFNAKQSSSGIKSAADKRQRLELMRFLKNINIINNVDRFEKHFPKKDFPGTNR